MAIKAIAWAFEQAITSTEKLVLLALADHANKENKCWIGVPAVCEKTSLSEKTVKGALRQLITAGLIHRKRREHNSSIYTLQILTQYSEPKGKPDPLATQAKGQMRPSQRVNATPPKGKSDPYNHSIIVKEPSIGEREQRAQKKPRSSLPPALLPIPAELEITNQIREYIAKNGMTVNPEEERDNFLNYCRANGKQWADYQAGFQRWLSKSKQFGDNNNGHKQWETREERIHRQNEEVLREYLAKQANHETGGSLCRDNAPNDLGDLCREAEPISNKAR